MVQRAQYDPSLLSSNDVLQLQRTLGNKAVVQLLRAKKRSQDSPAPKAPESKSTDSIVQLNRTESSSPQQEINSISNSTSVPQQSPTTTNSTTVVEKPTLMQRLTRPIVQLRRNIHQIIADKELLRKRRLILLYLKRGYWLKAYRLYRDLNYTPSGSGFFGSMSISRWLKGVWTLNKLRIRAKALTPPTTPEEQSAFTEEATNIASSAYANAQESGYSVDQYPNVIEILGKIVQYLIEATPKEPLHDQIVEDRLRDAPKNQENPKAIVMMGGSGSGKSSVRHMVLQNPRQYVVIDPDEVKEDFHQYGAGVRDGVNDIAFQVHKESKAVAQRIIPLAIGNKQNVFYDATGADSFGYEGMMRKLKDAGYHVKLVMSHVTVDEGLRRVHARAQATGRVVPDNVVKSIFSYVPPNFIKFLTHHRNIVDEAIVYNNMVPKGTKPRVLWRGNGTGAGNIDLTELRKLRVAIGLGTPEEFVGTTEQEEYLNKIEDKEFEFLSSGGHMFLKDFKRKFYGLESSEKSYDSNTERNMQAQRELLRQHGLTFAEAIAIGIYTADDYKYMNPASAGNEGWMRAMIPKLGFANRDMFASIKDGVTSEHVRKAQIEGNIHNQMAMSGLRKLPDWSGNTYRGLGLTPTEFREKYPLNGIAVMEAYTSTSKRTKEALSWAKNNISDEKFGVLLELQLTKGKDIKNYSKTAKEDEILVLPDAQFRVISIVDEEVESGHAKGKMLKRVSIRQIS